MPLYDLLYALIGVLAGLLSGLFGVGAGIIVVPGLAIVFAMNHIPHAILMRMAAGTSFAIMIFTASSSIYAHQRRGHFVLPVFLKMLPGLFVGVVSGAVFASYLPTRIVEILLAIFLLFVSGYMFYAVKPSAERELPTWPILSVITFLIGAKSGLLGIGGGTIIVPFLVYCNLPMRQAAGISAACTLPIAIIGMLSFIIIGWNVSTVANTTGYVYWPAVIAVAMASVLFAPVGAALAARLHGRMLKRIFSVMLLFVSFHLLVG